jgi:hypothetical protein
LPDLKDDPALRRDEIQLVSGKTRKDVTGLYA